jgi:hypothetical protein
MTIRFLKLRLNRSAEALRHPKSLGGAKGKVLRSSGIPPFAKYAKDGAPAPGRSSTLLSMPVVVDTEDLAFRKR